MCEGCRSAGPRRSVSVHEPGPVRSTAIGYGLNSIVKPNGGYYSRPVIIELRAQKLGRCTSSGPRAYTQLYFRVPSRSEGPLGPWQ
jgi:hypothetical protein